MKIKIFTILLSLICTIILSPVSLYSHYFPVAEVNHIVEITVDLYRISIKYVIWVPGGSDSVIIEKLNTSYSRHHQVADHQVGNGFEGDFQSFITIVGLQHHAGIVQIPDNIFP